MAVIERNIIVFNLNHRDGGMQCAELTDSDAKRIKIQLESGEIKANSVLPIQQEGGTKWVNMLNVSHINLKD